MSLKKKWLTVVSKEPIDVDTIIIKEEACDEIENEIVHPFFGEQSSEIFSWLNDVKNQCCSKAGTNNLGALLLLMKYFKEVVSTSVLECYWRPKRAMKLKVIMADILMYFHLMHSTIQKYAVDNDQNYITTMTDLVAMYVDMEIKASRTMREPLPKIASKLCASFSLYFGDPSHELVLTIMLKSKILSKHSKELSDLLFRRVLRDVPSTFTVLSYLQYILAFKRWKSVVAETETRNKIHDFAVRTLVPPPYFRERLSRMKDLQSVISDVPESCKNVTKYLLKSKFLSKFVIENFFKACANPENVYLNQLSDPTFLSQLKQKKKENESYLNHENIKEIHLLTYKEMKRIVDDFEPGKMVSTSNLNDVENFVNTNIKQEFPYDISNNNPQTLNDYSKQNSFDLSEALTSFNVGGSDLDFFNLINSYSGISEVEDSPDDLFGKLDETSTATASPLSTTSPLPSSSQLATSPLPSSSQLATSPLPSSSQLATSLLPSNSQLSATSPLPSTSHILTSCPLPSTSHLPALTHLPTTSHLLSTCHLPSTSQFMDPIEITERPSSSHTPVMLPSNERQVDKRVNVVPPFSTSVSQNQQSKTPPSGPASSRNIDSRCQNADSVHREESEPQSEPKPTSQRGSRRGRKPRSSSYSSSKRRKL